MFCAVRRFSLSTPSVPSTTLPVRRCVVLCSATPPERVHVLYEALRTALWRYAGIQLNGGKTRVWNAACRRGADRHRRVAVSLRSDDLLGGRLVLAAGPARPHRALGSDAFVQRHFYSSAPNTIAYSAASLRLTTCRPLGSHPLFLCVPASQLCFACSAAGRDLPLRRGTRCRCWPLPCHCLGLCGRPAASRCRTCLPSALADMVGQATSKCYVRFSLRWAETFDV